MTLKEQFGFTLIELSIVLVVIGLIVGGVLVGRDLIHAAELRSQIRQFEQFDAAVNTFRNKYDGLPGDLTPAIASSLGFFARSGGPGDGDGDGLVLGLGGKTTGYAYSTLGGETVLFWTDLSAVQLIPGLFSDNSDTLVNAITPSQYAAELPAAKLGGGNFIFATSVSVGSTIGNTIYENHYQVIHPANILSGDVGTNAAITPLDAFAIDQKVDDGFPTAGRVQAMLSSGAVAGLSIIQWLSDPCVQNGSPVVYNTANSLAANTPHCSLNVSAAW